MQPLTACNFIDLVQHGFYNGLLMHQVFADDVNLVSECLLVLTDKKLLSVWLSVYEANRSTTLGHGWTTCGIYM